MESDQIRYELFHASFWCCRIKKKRSQSSWASGDGVIMIVTQLRMNTFSISVNVCACLTSTPRPDVSLYITYTSEELDSSHYSGLTEPTFPVWMRLSVLMRPCETTSWKSFGPKKSTTRSKWKRSYWPFSTREIKVDDWLSESKGWTRMYIPCKQSGKTADDCLINNPSFSRWASQTVHWFQWTLRHCYTPY